jgi:hypothetical protein
VLLAREKALQAAQIPGTHLVVSQIATPITPTQEKRPPRGVLVLAYFGFRLIWKRKGYLEPSQDRETGQEGGLVQRPDLRRAELINQITGCYC